MKIPILDNDEQEVEAPQVEASEYEYSAIDPEIGDVVSEVLREELSLPESPSRAEILEALGDVLVKMTKESAQAKSPRDDKIREQVDVINLETPNRASPLGREGANIRTSLTRKNMDGLHAFWHQTITGIRPYLRTEAFEASGTEAANKLEDYYDGFYTEQCPLANVIDTALRAVLEGGFACFKPYWANEQKTVWATEVLSQENMADFGYKPVGRQLRGIPGEVVRGPKGKTARIGQVITGPKKVVIKDAPDIEVINYFDFVVCPADSRDLDNATFVGERFTESIASIRRKAINGLYDHESMERIAKDALRINDEHLTNIFSDSSVESTARDSDLDQPSKNEIKTGHVVEVVCGIVALDLDGDDESEDWMVAFETSTGAILYLRHYTYSHEFRNYRQIVPIPRCDSLYGMSIGDLLDGVQEQCDTAVNIALDAAALASTLIVEEQRGSSTMSEKLHIGINHRKVDEFGAIKVHNYLQGIDGKMFPSIELVERQATDVTALSETLQGQVKGTGETTATETNQALVSGSRRLEVGARRIQRAIVETHRIIHHLLCTHYKVLYQGNPEAQIPYVVRRADSTVGFGRITLQEFLTPVKWFAHGDTTNTNQGLKLQAAEKLFLAASQSPLMANKMSRQYAAHRFFLEAQGVRNISDFIGTWEEAQQMDKEAEQKAASTPQFDLPEVDKNINEQYYALLLAKNPDSAQQLIEALQQVMSVSDDNSGVAQVKQAQMEAEMASMDDEMSLKQQEMKLKEMLMQIEFKKKELGMAHKEASADLQHQQVAIAHQQEMGAMQQEHQLEQQQMGMENIRESARSEMGHREQMLKQKEAQAKAAPKPKTGAK